MCVLVDFPAERKIIRELQRLRPVRPPGRPRPIIRRRRISRLDATDLSKFHTRQDYGTNRGILRGQRDCRDAFR